MRCRRNTLSGLAAAVLLLGGGVVQAALQPVTSAGVNLVYSTGQDLTWTADANLFKTLCDAEGVSNCPNLIAAIIAKGSPVTHTSSVTFPSPHAVISTEFNQATGQMTWFAAKAWVAYLNSISYGGATDWRLWLPGPDPICSGINCTATELGYLYYTEGGLTSGNPITNSPLLTAVFDNLQNYSYCSGTEAPDPDGAWRFNANNGTQNQGFKDGPYYAWAVRPGQVTPPTPIPTLSEWAKILLALSLMGMAGWYWQRRTS